MITKRHIYEPLERIESAIYQLNQISFAIGKGHSPAIAKMINEVIARDLSEALEKLEYVQEIAS
jgi:hypothetical protein